MDVRRGTALLVVSYSDLRSDRLAFMSNGNHLTGVERMELDWRAASRTGSTEDARRARPILRLSEGHTWDETCERVPCSRGFVANWSKRFEEQRLAGMYSRHLGQVATVITWRLETRVPEATRTGAGRTARRTGALAGLVSTWALVT